jgi:hypothetical protein
MTNGAVVLVFWEKPETRSRRLFAESQKLGRFWFVPVLSAQT